MVEEVKLVLKPHYTKKHVTKEEYKDIMRKAVPKVIFLKSLLINIYIYIYIYIYILIIEKEKKV